MPRIGFGFRTLLPVIALAGLLGVPGAQAAPVKIALLTGDASSAAALAAVHELRQDPALRNVTVRVFPRIEFSQVDRHFVAESDILIGYPRYAALLRGLADEIRAAGQRGSLLAAVGETLEPESSDLGFRRDPELAAYFDAGGQANLAQMVRAALARHHLPELEYQPPSMVPPLGFFDPADGRAYANAADCAAALLARHPERRNQPWVGVYFSRDTATSGQTELLSAIAGALADRGFNALFGFGYPPDVALSTLFLGTNPPLQVEAIIGLTLKIGNVPEKLAPVLAQLDVPLVNAIALNNQTRTAWERSPVGLDVIERHWQIGSAEFAGTIAPTIVASKERLVDVATGQTYVMTMPIPERIERLADRIAALVRLRHLPNAAKRVAVIYYNYPPGRESIGASYLNVLPRSLHEILNRLRGEGYALTGAPADADALFTAIRTFGNNPPPGSEATAMLDALARSGRVALLPVTTYRAWFDRLPESLRRQIVNQWGEPEQSTVMIWRNDDEKPFFVFPAQRWGNVLLAPQPTRGWKQDIVAAYHDVTLPPHHQYLAFYLWLQHEFDAHAMVHVGTHATHEWLPGKEVGFTAADTGEVIVGAVPQFYPFIVDDVGEGLQAKRRAMAAIITHLPPPLDRASLNPELREINGLINDYHVAQEKGGLAGEEQLERLARLCAKMGLFTDLGIELPDGVLLNDAQVEEIQHHLKRIGEKLTPFGMHTFGVAPDEPMRAATAEAVLSLEPELEPEEYARRKAALMHHLELSGPAELDALVAGLAGRHIPASPGNDPVRNPDALPTGRNCYGFDPSRMPSPATAATGAELAAELIESYRERHDGQFPDRLVFNLWGTETSRHEGVMEAQILALMGVRLNWDARGRVQGVTLIPREELGRPRVDVTVIPSGLYRDLFPNLMRLLDEAVNVVKTDTSADNPLLRNIAATRAALEERGVASEEAERLATVRLFSLPSGTYGAGLDHVIQQAEGWTNELQVAEVFFNRMSHLFGQGFWGARAPQSSSGEDLSPALLGLALKGAKGVVHSRSSNVYGAIDSDDFYQYLGGTALAVRRVNGAGAETLISDLSNPKAGETVTLQRFMGREMRARYLNPKWITAMLKEGYAGARMIRQVTDNLWGWQVTVPEAVDAAKWQEMFETYVEDRHGLGVREQFAAAENLGAYQALLDRMLTVIEKGYWQAAPETVTRLQAARAELAPAVAAETQSVARRAEAALEPAPGPTVQPSPATPAMAQPAAPPPSPIVQGRVLEEQALPRRESARPNGGLAAAPMRLWALAGLALGLLAFGWWRQGAA
ncbi:MAG: cobaltochelatase subunit CobN [Verrucomicrobiales bacterium]|nr:cobaltochelatase subunit CobN [Verrucomicrobiales bacterium]MCP5527767.1 cobaltochelatase subunit CobN [Verrucomicrobiales bacterium]